MAESKSDGGKTGSDSGSGSSKGGGGGQTQRDGSVSSKGSGDSRASGGGKGHDAERNSLAGRSDTKGTGTSDKLDSASVAKQADQPSSVRPNGRDGQLGHEPSARLDQSAASDRLAANATASDSNAINGPSIEANASGENVASDAKDTAGKAADVGIVNRVAGKAAGVAKDVKDAAAGAANAVKRVVDAAGSALKGSVKAGAEDAKETLGKTTPGAMVQGVGKMIDVATAKDPAAAAIDAAKQQAMSVHDMLPGSSARHGAYDAIGAKLAGKSNEEAFEKGFNSFADHTPFGKIADNVTNAENAYSRGDVEGTAYNAARATQGMAHYVGETTLALSGMASEGAPVGSRSTPEAPGASAPESPVSPAAESIAPPTDAASAPTQRAGSAVEAGAKPGPNAQVRGGPEVVDGRPAAESVAPPTDAASAPTQRAGSAVEAGAKPGPTYAQVRGGPEVVDGQRPAAGESAKAGDHAQAREGELGPDGKDRPSLSGAQSAPSESTLTTNETPKSTPQELSPAEHDALMTRQAELQANDQQFAKDAKGDLVRDAHGTPKYTTEYRENRQQLNEHIQAKSARIAAESARAPRPDVAVRDHGAPRRVDTQARTGEQQSVGPRADQGGPRSGAVDAHGPTVERPTVERPTVERPTVERPTVERPTVERPTVERPTVERPTVERPLSPTVEGPTVAPKSVEATTAELQKGTTPETTPTLDRPLLDGRAPLESFRQRVGIGDLHPDRFAPATPAEHQALRDAYASDARAQSWAPHINPGYAAERAAGLPGRTHNCVEVARAVQETYEGQPRAAASINRGGLEVQGEGPHLGENGRYLEQWSGQRLQRTTWDAIGTRVQAEQGSAIVIGESAYGAHAFNAIYENGSVKLVDGQSGKVYDWNSSPYQSKYTNFYSVHFPGR